MLDRIVLNTRAQELREQLGDDSNSPIDIFSLANQIDRLTLVFYPLGDNISGLCYRDSFIKLIAINSMMSYGRQRFSLAHELYHLFYDDETGFNVCSKTYNSKSDNEKNADQFASYFLAPYKPLNDFIKKITSERKFTIQDVIMLEQHFGMSHLAMLWRLVSEGVISSDKVEEYGSGVVSMARNLGYNDKLYKPTPIEIQKRTYGYYLKQVEELRSKNLVSYGKIDELLLNAFREDIVFGLEEDEKGGGAID